MRFLQNKITIIISIFVLILGVLIAHFSHTPNLPPLRDGDLVFQLSTSDQAAAIVYATGSIYSHMGMIKKVEDQYFVVEAIETVQETPLDKWINEGLFQRVAVYRHQDMTPDKSQKILANAKKYYGKAYDLYFSFDNQTLYCSELPYLTFGETGISLGKVQKISELNFDNFLVRDLIEKRWKKHPSCQNKGFDFEACYQAILNQSLISPASISQDPALGQIYSNFWLW